MAATKRTPDEIRRREERRRKRIEVDTDEAFCEDAAECYDEVLPRFIKMALLEFINSFPAPVRHFQTGRCNRLLPYLFLPAELTGIRSDMTLAERFDFVEVWARGLPDGEEWSVVKASTPDELMQTVAAVVRGCYRECPEVLLGPPVVHALTEHDIHSRFHESCTVGPNLGSAVFLPPYPDPRVLLEVRVVAPDDELAVASSRAIDEHRQKIHMRTHGSPKQKPFSRLYWRGLHYYRVRQFMDRRIEDLSAAITQGTVHRITEDYPELLFGDRYLTHADDPQEVADEKIDDQRADLESTTNYFNDLHSWGYFLLLRQQATKVRQSSSTQNPTAESSDEATCPMKRAMRLAAESGPDCMQRRALPKPVLPPELTAPRDALSEILCYLGAVNAHYAHIEKHQTDKQHVILRLTATDKGAGDGSVRRLKRSVHVRGRVVDSFSL